MNADERGMNLAEKKPAHGGYPDVKGIMGPRPCVRTWSFPIPDFKDGGLPDVDWEGVAGRAFQEKHEAEQELQRLRREMPPDVLREYDRRYHGGP